MNDRPKIILLCVLAVAAIGVLVFFVQRESAAASGGALDLNDPKVKSQLKEHYEGMDRSNGPFSNMQSGGPGGAAASPPQ